MNSMDRPKLTIPKAKSEWVWDVIGYSSYIGSVILLIAVWGKLPDKVPAHYNLLGEIDRWGSKGELLVLPLVSAFTALFVQAAEKYPQWHNYPKRFNETNAAQFYLHSRKLMNQIKNICLIVFAFILFDSISIAQGWNEGFGGWTMPLLLFGVFFPIGLGIYRQRKIK